MKTNPISLACDVVGGMGVLAGIIGVSAPTISQWRTGIRPVPLERCTAIEQATNGQVTRKDLRPDDWEAIWPELTDKKAA